MKRISILPVVVMLSIWNLGAQEFSSNRLSYIDGFSLNVTQGYAFAGSEYTWLDDLHREVSSFVITTPRNVDVHGMVLYEIGISDEMLKDDLFPMIRYLYRDFSDLESQEAVGLFSIESDPLTFLFYYAVGDFEFAGLIVTLFDSPGFATACILYITDPSIASTKQEEIMEQLSPNFRVEFEEAAG